MERTEAGQWRTKEGLGLTSFVTDLEEKFQQAETGDHVAASAMILGSNQPPGRSYYLFIMS